MVLMNVGFKENLIVKGQEIFLKTKCRIDKIENKLIERRNKKGIVVTLDEITYMKNMSLAKTKEDVVSLNKFLSDKKYKGIIELPTFGFSLQEVLMVYKHIIDPGTFYIKLRHGKLDIIEPVNLKVRKFINNKGEKDVEVYIESKRILDYSKIRCFCVNI